MSLGRYYSVVCDGCGRATPTRDRGKEARADAKRCGWKHVKTKRVNRWRTSKPPLDFCSECAAAKGEGEKR